MRIFQAWEREREKKNGGKKGPKGKDYNQWPILYLKFSSLSAIVVKYVIMYSLSHAAILNVFNKRQPDCQWNFHVGKQQNPQERTVARPAGTTELRMAGLKTVLIVAFMFPPFPESRMMEYLQRLCQAEVIDNTTGPLVQTWCLTPSRFPTLAQDHDSTRPGRQGDYTATLSTPQWCLSRPFFFLLFY